MSEPRQVQAILRLLREVAGDDLLGAYLHGSAVLGGLRPASDLDVLVVLGRRTTASDRQALVEGLLDVSGAQARSGPARPVELTVVAADDIKPWRYPPREELLYGEWLRDDFEQGTIPAPGPAPDLAILITLVLQGGAALAGPPPAQLLDPVPRADLIRGAVAGIPHLLGDLDSDTRNVLLTLARIWTTVETGEIRTKDAAADWALARLPADYHPVLAQARDMYLEGVTKEHWPDPAAVRAHADYVVNLIQRAEGGEAEAHGQR